MIDDPKIFDSNYWKYQRLLEGYIRTLKNSPHILNDEKLFAYSLAHIAKKIYEKGQQDGLESSTEDIKLLIAKMQQGFFQETQGEGILN